MKKIISSILIFAMCISLVACSAVGNKSKTPNSGANDENGTDYSIVRDNGEYFIIFDDIATYQGDMQELASISFPSMKEFKDTVTKGKLTDSQKRIMATAFKRDDDGKILACDFDNLFVPKLPATGSVTDVSWSGGNNYSFSMNLDGEIFGWYHYLTESEYTELYQRDYLNLFERKNINVTSTETIDDNKSVIYSSTSAGEFKDVRFTLSAGEKTFVVDKTYRLKMNDLEIKTSSDVPFSIALYCIDGEERYVISLYGFTSDPSDEWLLSFGIEKFSE